MPKLKTNKSVKKRIKVTKNGKVMRKRAGKSHLMASFSGGRVRKLRRPAFCAPGEAKVYKRMLLAE